MTTPFTRTLQVLRADHFRWTHAGLLISTLMLFVWAGWFMLGRLTLFEVASAARLEVDRSAYVIQAPVAARIVSSSLEIGREVRAGDLLVELDVKAERLQVEESRSRFRALETQMDALGREIASVQETTVRDEQASRSAEEEARARIREAQARLAQAERESARVDKLVSAGLTAAAEAEKFRAEMDSLRATVESLKPGLVRIGREQQTRNQDREARINRLTGEISRIEGQRDLLKAGLGRLQYEVERRIIRSPVDGRLGDVTVLRPGSFVEDGAKLCAIVPAGQLHIVAAFPPRATVGRLERGQSAQLRLHGFPWAQYGAIPATVTSVGNEVRNGAIRVELGIPPGLKFPVKLEHGMEGTVEVRVEQVAPVEIVLRAAGQKITSPRRGAVE